MNASHTTSSDELVASHVPLTDSADRIRWGAVIAGLFGAICTLIVLGVLGLAIGLTGFDPASRAQNYGVGAGIAGVISALIAFFIGGWLAGRTTGITSTRARLIHGAMVWIVAIPLLGFAMGIGARDLAYSATSLTGAEMGGSQSAQGRSGADWQRAPSAMNPALNPNSQNAQQPQVTQGSPDSTTSPMTSREVARDAAKAAWVTFVSFVLGLAAAILGAYAAARSARRDVDVYVAPA